MPLDGVETQTIWRPQYRADGSRGPQFALLTCPYDEIFFGGARGGGKTAGMLGHWLAHAQRYGSKARGVFFRRRYKQLEEVQRQANELFPRLGAIYTKAEALWTFPNGAVLTRIMHVISHFFVVLYEVSTSGRALASPAAAAGLDDFGGLRLTT